jgi:hypothetical protein
MKIVDPNGLSSTDIVFNTKKFYPGRAIMLEGTDGEGDSINGTFLIQSVKMDKLYVIDSSGREFDFDILLFVGEEEEDFTYPSVLQVEFYGEDRT